MKNKLYILLLTTFIVKISLLIFSEGIYSFYPDEESNFQIAKNYIEGKNYTNQQGELSAFHGSFTVLLYKAIIRSNINKYDFIAVYNLLSLLIFIFSIPYIYKILILFKVGENIAFISTALYSFYPSNLIYIGNLGCYEKFVLPLLVICFYILLRAFKENKVGSLWLLPGLVTLSCLLRVHLIIVYFLLFVVFGVYLIFNRHEQKFITQKIIVYILTGSLMIFAHIPLLKKNYDMFGEYILSTQIGYELMQGHNDLARGSWYRNWSTENNPYHLYSKINIQNLDSLNQYEEGVARKEFALKWIKSNPTKELELILRKTGIFLLPKNHNGGYNLINIFVHIMFILAIFLMLVRRKFDANSLFMLTPVIAVFLLCQIFFVGLRWRYYAEPFMILFATYQIIGFAYSRKLLRP